jgi:DNA-binding LytR/AlgR family response regulator
MNCIIIDNDPAAIDNIKKHAAKTPFLTIQSCFQDTTEGLSSLYLHTAKADLVFFNIHMANQSDLELIKLLENKSLFIFTSGNAANALISYELNAVDFLLKPIIYERFIKAVYKAEEIFNLRRNNRLIPEQPAKENEEFIFLKSGTQIHKINIDDILYLEKESNYFVIHFHGNKKLLIRINFSDLLSLLPEHKFMRVHKSYVVGFKHIDYIEGNNIIVNKEHIPLAVTYKNEFMKVINA